MLLLLVSLAVLSAAWGQTSSNCSSTIRHLQASQQTLVNTTAQIQDMLSKHTQQQLTSESQINLMQLTSRSVNTATNSSLPACSCDCNETAIALKQLVAQSKDNREAIRNLTADIERQSMDTIHNLTAVVENLVQRIIKYQVCGSSGWTRVAYLNMTNPSEQCPSGFRLYNQSGIRACGRPATGYGGCQSSVQFTSDISYSEVCGRVTGYQYSRPEAFNTIFTSRDRYVDGVSLTHGFPRKHIWTFAAGKGSNLHGGSCPCATRSTDGVHVPSFVGSDYFCESGHWGQRPTQQLYPEPLWDGKGCSNLETPCCQAAGIPWFHKRLNTTTFDNIELRICADFHTDNEDIPIGHYEIYVK